jgi:hypothetical protein
MQLQYANQIKNWASLGNMRSIWRVSCFACGTLFLCCCISINANAQVNIIFDTDIGSDCDDAGALAVLHKLSDKGEVNILGVIFSSNKNKYGIGVCDAINTYYGRGDLPLGQYKGIEVGDPKNYYSREIAVARSSFHHNVVDSTTELVIAYKNILEKQPDTSVTIVSVGHPHGLFFLLRDPAGFKLIKQKVKSWIAMAYAGTSPHRGWNFGRNGAEFYIESLLKDWPTPIFISGAGGNIITGNKKLPLTPAVNPVRRAYELWNNALIEGRSSWDQVAVLFAARPSYFNVGPNGTLQQNIKSETFWNVELDNPKHHRVIPEKANSELEDIIEDLMSEPPSKVDVANHKN